jgi:hypothetical protein
VGGDGAEQRDHGDGGAGSGGGSDADADAPPVGDHAPILWEDRPFSPANEPPGWWEHLSARHPTAAGLAMGSSSAFTLAVPPGLDRPWWSLASVAAAWLVVWPAANTWLWRAGGRRRRDYDRRVRASVGGAARLSG